MRLIACIFIFLLAPFAVRANDLADQVIAEINLARTNPQQYAQVIATETAGHQGVEGDRAFTEAIRFLSKARPLPPLTASTGMCNSALSYVLLSGPVGGRGHKGSDGSQPWDRMGRFGKWSGSAGENIDYGLHNARAIVVRLIVDDGERDRGHRKNIFSTAFHVAGAATGYHATYGAMCVIDFAGSFVETPGRVASRSTSPAAAL